MSTARPLPGLVAPPLKVPLVDGPEFELATEQPESFSLVVFYRGVHCPLCKKQLRAIESKLDRFTELGVDVIAISADDAVRARKARIDWDIERLRIGYSLDLDDARRWGLYISSAIKDGEPDKFTEPGLFLIRSDGTVYSVSVQSVPFARPAIDDVLSAVSFVRENDYPPRGTVA